MRAFSSGRAAGTTMGAVGCSPASESSSAGRAAALATIGVAALGIGVLFYLADRDTARTALIPAVASIAGGHLFGAIGQWLPSFVHPFAFSLLTAAVPARTALPGYGACAGWWMVNVAFEAGQHPGIRPAVAEGVDAVLGRTWISGPLSGYFLNGTYDAGDLVAVTAGALAAAGILHFLRRREVDHGH